MNNESQIDQPRTRTIESPAGLQAQPGGSCPSADPQVAPDKLSAFTYAAAKYRPRFLQIALRVTRRPEEAEDVVQTGLMKAFANLQQFRGESQMSTWLRAIVHNAAREYARNTHGRVFISLDAPPCPNSDMDSLELPAPCMNPEEHLESRERGETLSAAMEKLSLVYQDTLRMCILEETPYARVATALNVRVSTVKSRVHRSKQALKAALRARPGTDK